MKERIKPFNLLTSPLASKNLIEASAGTGKTFTIEGIYLRLLLEKKMVVENILVVTFTEAATSELRERIRDKIRKALQAFETGQGEYQGDDLLIQHLIESSTEPQLSLNELKTALAQFDSARIFTIHGFCHRVLLDFTFESQSRFDTEFIKDQRDLLSEIAQDFWRNHLYQGTKYFTAFLMGRFGDPQKLAQKLVPILNRPLKYTVTGLSPDKLESRVQSAESLFMDLSKIWPNSQAELEEILIHHPGLGHKSYSKRFVPKWLEEMEHYMRSGNPFLSPKNLFRFSMGVISQHFNNNAEPPDHAVFHICQELDPLLTSIGVQLENNLIDYAKNELKKRKQQRNLISFDDLLKNLRDALHGLMGEKLASRIRDRYHVALIDEFQDTDPIQFEIFSTVFNREEHPVFYIGDPKQSIYNFRGADIFAYLTAQQRTDIPYTLEKNWRSDNDLIQAINSVFTFRENPFLFEEIAFYPSTSAGKNRARGFQIDGQPQIPFHLWYVDDNGKTLSKGLGQKKVTKAVATEIARLLNLSREGKATFLRDKPDNTVEETALAPAHIAILVRKHSESEAVQQALRKRSVPSVINTKSTVFNSPEFSEVTSLLKAIANPASEHLVKRALVTDIMGVNGEQLQSYEIDESGWEKILERFQYYRQTWAEAGFYVMIRRFIRKQHVRSRLLEVEGGERKLTNLLHILELFHGAENNNRLGMNGLLKWADRQRFSPEESEDESEIRLETDAEAVKILTIHASKGLEFPIVFCPFSWGSAAVKQVFFHDPDDDNALCLDLGSPDYEENKTKAKKEILAEEIRLLYVALTRAKHRCYLVWGDINQAADSAMAYLFHNGKPSKTIWEDLRKLEKEAGGNIKLQRLPEGSADKYGPGQDTIPELRCLEFKGSSALDWGISSFSRLSSKTAVNIEYPDRDQVKKPSFQTEDHRTEKADSPLNMFSLPGGAKTGNCFHELFENLDFQETDPQRIRSLVSYTLQRYDFEDRWQPVAVKLVENVLSTPLFQDDIATPSFSLSDLGLSDRISEMEFYFPLQHITSNGLADVLQPHLQSDSAQRLSRTLKRLNFNEIRGFMKGFIDLIFQHNGRYYILDWKTNYLGDRASDYHTGHLQSYMIDHSFILQYIIYTVALHRFLRLKLESYDFKTHFGGVFYFFLRGIQKNPDPDIGIYKDSLHGCADMIEDLSHYFGGDR